jgi:hypothetical protein
MAFFLEVVKNGLEDFAVGDGVVDILVVVCGSLFKDVKLFDSVEVGAFVVGVQNLHAFLYVAKCVLLCCRSI